MSRTSALSYDLAVIGGGSAGIVGAKTAASLGARVVLIERERTGGDCLWTGCVPSKTLIASAHSAAVAHAASRYGIDVGPIAVDFTEIMRRVQRAIEDIEPLDSPAALEQAGVNVLAGHARFTGKGRLEVDGVVVPYRRALLATGARPAVPEIPGLDSIPYLTSETLWDLQHLPGRLVVLGAGSIGCELGQAFARLGSEVTIVEGLERILHREDSDASEAVLRSIQADGVSVRTGHRAVSVTATGDDSGTLMITDGETTTHIAFDQLLVAVGRTPNTGDAGLDAAGVVLDDRGFVVVDPMLRTTNKRIWAAGDLTGHPQFTHAAGVHGSLAASNAVLGLRRRVDLRAMPRVTFTDPEVAAVGATTEADDLPDGLRQITRDHRDVDRAVTDGLINGFSRLAVDARGRIAGATVVGPRAGETLAELTLAVRKRLRSRDLAATIHPYPTYADGPWKVTIDDMQARLSSPSTRRATRLLGALARLRARVTT